MKTILIQAAMEKELVLFLDYFKDFEKQVIAGYDFYIGEFQGLKLVISQTQNGVMNATESTTIAMLTFSPDYVINEGTCGAHLQSLEVGDLIIGEDAVYINKFKSPAKKKGEGSNSLEWIPAERGSFRIKANEQLLEVAKKVCPASNVFFGTIGTGDLFSKEVDRIEFLRNTFGELCEEMETVAVYKVCESFGVPCLGIRIVSNNELVEGVGTLQENIEKIMPRVFDVVMKIVQELAK